MNSEHSLYTNYLEISNDWPLDDWSITKECFDKIVEILPFNKTILEIGSGNATRVLSNFYNMISIESNPAWLNKYNSKYLYVPVEETISEEFGKTKWLDSDILQKKINNLNYDLLIVDSGGDRVAIYDNMHLFNTEIPIIFDDTMNEGYLKCATLISEKYNYNITTFQCKRNKFCVHWWDGKKYSLLEK